MWRLPLEAIPRNVFGGLTDQLQTYLRNQHTEFWRIGELHGQVTVPVMQITGWWDRLIGASDNYAGLVADGPHELRGAHRLIIGPWGHDVTDFPRQIGPIDYGPLSRASYADLLVRWFDRPGIRRFLRITIGAEREMTALLRAVKAIQAS